MVVVYIDIETTGVRPMQHEIAVLTYALNSSEPVLIECVYDNVNHVKSLFDLEQATYVFHHARFDLAFLYAKYGILPKSNTIEDVMYASQVLRKSRYGHTLEAITERYLNKTLKKDLQQTFGPGDWLTREQVEYCKHDVMVLRELLPVLLSQLQIRGLSKEYRRRCDAVIPSIIEQYESYLMG